MDVVGGGLGIFSNGMFFSTVNSGAFEICFLRLERGVVLGKFPVPKRSQLMSTFSKAPLTFKINSRLGLFRPDKIWEMLERGTLILSAKLEAETL